MVKGSSKMEARVERIEQLLESLSLDRERDDERFRRLEAMIESISRTDSERTETQRTAEAARRTEESRRTEEAEQHAGDGNFHHGRDTERWKKLDIPVYDGDEDAFGWVTKLERYFHIRGAAETEKLQAVIVALEGKALSWFQWWESCNPEVNWEGFKSAIIERFQTSAAHSPFAALLALKQHGAVEEFVTQFEKYSGMLNGVGEDQLMAIFVNGLKEEIGTELKLYEPRNLSTMVKKTLMIDKKNQAVLKTGGTSWSGESNLFRSPTFIRSVTVDTGQNAGHGGNQSYSSSTGSVVGGNAEKTINRSRPGGYKWLSEAETQEKIRKGECFRCGDKYGPNHVCKNKQFRVMLLADEEETRGEKDDGGNLDEGGAPRSMAASSFSFFPP